MTIWNIAVVKIISNYEVGGKRIAARKRRELNKQACFDAANKGGNNWFIFQSESKNALQLKKKSNLNAEPSLTFPRNSSPRVILTPLLEISNSFINPTLFKCMLDNMSEYQKWLKDNEHIITSARYCFSYLLYKLIWWLEAGKKNTIT